MSVSTTVLFDQPQNEIATRIRAKLAQCRHASIVVGFATVEGVKAITEPLKTHPGKLSKIVVGAATYRAFDALDYLASFGIPVSQFFVHLGHSRQTGKAAKHPFYRYHPMLHSKVYYFDMGDGTACAFIGSHNMTGFALLGLNGEASVQLEGDVKSPQFSSIRAHIDESVAQAVPYDPALKEAYSWWTSEYLEGLKQKANDIPRDGESKRTIVIIAEADQNSYPKDGDKIYFEIPEALGKLGTMNAEVHIHLFAKLPPTPADALLNLQGAFASLWCTVVGLEDDQGGAELDADWEIGSRRSPRLSRTSRPFRPHPSPSMQQVRIETRNQVYGKFEYLFESAKKNWEPVFNEERALKLSGQDLEMVEELELVPPEHLDWFAVTGFKATDGKTSKEYKEALRESSPMSGSFVLMSLRRRTR
jgi:HKD family nuclease